LAQARASEVGALLQRLSDVNDEMGGVIGGGSDARAHTLARHRDVLQEYTQARSHAVFMYLFESSRPRP
jgi:Golgi SNAP receptor complex protein 1